MARVVGRASMAWKGDELLFGRRCMVNILQDQKYPSMWRVKLPAGGLTDMLNRTRAKDAALAIALGILNKTSPMLQSRALENDRNRHPPAV
jgi:hypothetical protein